MPPLSTYRSARAGAILERVPSACGACADGSSARRVLRGRGGRRDGREDAVALAEFLMSRPDHAGRSRQPSAPSSRASQTSMPTPRRVRSRPSGGRHEDGRWRPRRLPLVRVIRRASPPGSVGTATRQSCRARGRGGWSGTLARFAWEADTLPAELLPLEAERVIADRARGEEGSVEGPECSRDILRRRQTLAVQGRLLRF